MRFTSETVSDGVSQHLFTLNGVPGVVEAAARVRVPVEFLLQWDDELVPRDTGLALFDAFASAEKTLHANPGSHFRVPSFEIDSSIRFFARHLGSPGTASSS